MRVGAWRKTKVVGRGRSGERQVIDRWRKEEVEGDTMATEVDAFSICTQSRCDGWLKGQANTGKGRWMTRLST